MTKLNVGKYLMVCKTMDGLVEEWRFTFCDWGLVMVSSLNSSLIAAAGVLVGR